MSELKRFWILVGIIALSILILDYAIKDISDNDEKVIKSMGIVEKNLWKVMLVIGIIGSLFIVWKDYEIKVEKK